MLHELSLDEFLKLATTAERVNVYRKIPADRLTPVGIVESLTHEMQDGAILESGLRHEETGRHSFIAFESMAQLIYKNQKVTQRIGSKITTPAAHPFAALRLLISQLSCAGGALKQDFSHGAVGFITYDAVRLFESIPDRHATDYPLPDMLFNFYKTTLMFDHLQQNLLISMIVEVGDNPQATYREAQEKISALIEKITTGSSQKLRAAAIANQANFSAEVDINDEQFAQLVIKAKEYITAGDAFQIVLSRKFIQRFTVAPFDIYRTLRRVSPAPYMFYLPFENSVIIGASPEKLISVRDQEVAINPIAGTRKRSEKNADEQIADELLNDKKELAEHMMLVDLARNDLGAVCEPGSVKVTDLLKVKHFSHVSHITSVVTGKLKNNLDALDALAAAFPAGTLSGAPKIRAMEIIDELETSRRGLYGGAICRLDYNGNLDSCIAIRMAVLNDGIATVRAGAGIVHDSNPKLEAQETRQKVQGMLEAISLAQHELDGDSKNDSDY